LNKVTAGSILIFEDTRVLLKHNSSLKIQYIRNRGYAKGASTTKYSSIHSVLLIPKRTLPEQVEEEN